MKACPFCSRPFEGELCPRCDDAVDVEKVLGVLGADRPSSLPPREIGRFRIVRPLGEGGTGIVYEAMDPVLGRSVALKILKPHGLSPELVERFLREARFLGRFRHPNVVQIYELGKHEGRDFLAMELVEGKPFPATSERREAVARLARAARALGHIHRRSIVHRDLKPSNILVDAAGRPVIMDFGIARSAEALSTLSLAGSLIGTPAYMAPEQFEGETADARTDVYSLGIMLYEILAGRRPFEGRTIVALAQQVRQGSPPGIPGVPGELLSACLRALAVRPEDRFATADAFADALEAHLQGRRAEPRRPAGWLRRYPRAVGAIGGALLGLLAVAALLALRPAARPRVDPAPFVQEGRRLSLLGRFEEAQAAFDRALAEDPGFVDAVTAKGETTLTQQFAMHADRLRFPETVRALGARLAGLQGPAFDRLGAPLYAQIARGQWEDALKGLPPGDERLHSALRFFVDGRYPGSAARSIRESDLDVVQAERDVWLLYAAVHELRPLLARFPNAGRNSQRPTPHAGLLRLQALIHEARGEKDKALDALEKAVAAAPDFLLARLARAQLLGQKAEVEAALGELQQARRQAVEWKLPVAEIDFLLR